MFSSWKVAKFFGTDVQIHWTFWLLPAWIVLNGQDPGLFPLWMHLLLVAALFVCVVMHEFGHVLTARRFGIRTPTITLTPLGGIAQLERMTHQPWEEFCIAIAGPLVNVAIAFVLAVGLIAAELLGVGMESSAVMRFLGVLLGLNLAMIVFNMIPAFPMDGGRVLRAILANSLGLLPGTRVAVAVGIVAALGMAFVGMLINPWLIMIALFVIWAGVQELRGLEMNYAEIDEDLPIAIVPKTQRAQITLCLWDPQRQQWVRRTFDEPNSKH